MGQAGAAMRPFLRPDILFALGIIAILMFMLVPVSPMVLDFGLSISISASVMVLMLVLFIQMRLKWLIG